MSADCTAPLIFTEWDFHIFVSVWLLQVVINDKYIQWVFRLKYIGIKEKKLNQLFVLILKSGITKVGIYLVVICHFLNYEIGSSMPGLICIQVRYLPYKRLPSLSIKPWTSKWYSLYNQSCSELCWTSVLFTWLESYI